MRVEPISAECFTVLAFSILELAVPSSGSNQFQHCLLWLLPKRLPLAVPSSGSNQFQPACRSKAGHFDALQYPHPGRTNFSAPVPLSLGKSIRTCSTLMRVEPISA